MRYINYHKHTMYSNIRTIDSITKPEEYMKRAVELGHKEYITMEHGFQGNIFEAYTLCEKYGLKCIFGVEAYYVDDKNIKDVRTAYHICLISLTEKSRFEINKILSKANTDGFYYKPRIDLSDLLSLTPSDTVITTACIASRMFKEGWDEKFFIPVLKHFKNNFYLEVQDHFDDGQILYNQKIIDLHRKMNIPIIHANDSHYIYPSDSINRNLFLKAKEIVYEDESNFILDYPDYETIVERYKKQGVLTEEEITEAIKNTLIFDKSEGIKLDKEFKIPKIISGDSNLELKKLINEGWKKERNNIPKEKWPEYLEQIKYEYKIVEDCGMADYFILDHYIVNKSVKEYNAVLTRSGRGSAVSFYINKLLGLTEVDRISAPIKLYPTRFMSAERILASRSLPDIDLNFADVKPVIKASKDILGEDGIYYMVAYKPLQDSSAFRMWCKAKGMNIDEYNDIAKNIDDYREDKKWKDIIEESKIFIGVIESVAPSPCSFLLSNDPISEKIGLIKVGEEICCCLDGYNCDVYKYLKNDYLTVSVYDIINKTYQLIGRDIDDIKTLISNCDNLVWDVYAKGLTTTINQADSDYDKQILQKYKPKNLAEMSAYVAAIRPGFASLLNNFVERKPYSTGVDELDNILDDSFHYLMYQESIMKYLVWLGMEEKGTYDVIKKIAKKKFKAEELDELKEKLLKGWIDKVGKVDGFYQTWEVVELSVSYCFNASHSLSVAIDSLYGAYLKSHYPIEYFTVALTLYNNDLTRTANLVDEMPYFGLQLKDIEFGHSKAEYNMDKENNFIYKGMASIKYMNAEVSNKLYEMSKEKEYKSFLDIVKDFPGNSRQLDILIKLGYFSAFGPIEYLLECVKVIYDLDGRKTISKDKCDIDPVIIKKYSNETEKQYKIFDINGLINNVINNIDKKSLKSFTIRDLCEAQLEYLGYISYKNPSMIKTGYVCDINLKNSPKITIYALNDGTTKQLKMYKKQYAEAPFDKGDVITYGVTTKQKTKYDPDKKEFIKLSNEFEEWISWFNIKIKKEKIENGSY